MVRGLCCSPSKGSVLSRTGEPRQRVAESADRIDLVAGHKESFTASNLGIDVPDTKVDLLDPVVSVQIEIAEVRSKELFPASATGRERRLRSLSRVRQVFSTD
jgi:hypothetical protein